MARTVAQQAVDDGTWKNGSTAADLAGDAAQQDQRAGRRPSTSACTASRAATAPGSPSAGSIATPEAIPRNENHPNMLTQVSWTSPVTSRLLLEANVQFGPVLLVGQPAEESVRCDADSGAGGRRAARFLASITGRPANWSGHTGLHEHLPGIRVVRDRVALGEVRLPLPPQRREVPDQLLQQHSAQVQLPGRRPLPVHDVRRPGVAPGTACRACSRCMRRIDGRSAGCRCRAASASST